MLTVSIFVLAFGAVYELFSHGVISLFMILAFLIPLVFAAVPYLAFHKLNKNINRVSVSLYNSAIYVFTAGSIIKGALEIYGTTNSLLAVYPIAGAILTAAAGISLRLHFLPLQLFEFEELEEGTVCHIDVSLCDEFEGRVHLEYGYAEVDDINVEASDVECDGSYLERYFVTVLTTAAFVWGVPYLFALFIR